MRKSVLILGVVVASLGLSACGSGAKATIDSSVASLGAQSDLQVHFTASVAGAGTAEAQKVLNVVSMDTDYATARGTPLSQSKGATDGEVTFNVGAKVAARPARDRLESLRPRRPHGGQRRSRALPLTSQDQSELAALQLFLGGKWFEIPAAH